MSVRVVVDTNVLVYTQDADEPERHDRAIEVLDQLVEVDGAALTTQVLAEYYVTVTRRFGDRLNAELAAEQVRRFTGSMPVFDTSLAVVLEALRGVVRYRMSYYDAQIWAAARLNGVGVVLSEDFQDGQEVEGVRFVDPFAPGFDTEAL
ncbi:MAG: PIN domain-containing protein [Anaerosomatales bacterium]|nr:PIN domain-containing protein [Anaerosomatales bacterium]MDT8434459.1 PIN domain-containing protein [Anaerosomatales bacterium]